MLITRKEYDQLLKINPQFMETSWIKLRRQWSVEGIDVSIVLDDDWRVVKVLEYMLNVIRGGS